ncbi:hypothetical protein J3R30DRAFT_3706717 [Lentinula aciculospora]|uniref:Myosin-binding domain-containing protein n=1 Tax=Lentinula aciculospora TaxID=153920 RepID=A0A9W9A687_9AGAR|nr:hypothetical protein J3R30DRAFT_3706717 [Lentinula aciculospora]
MAQPVFDDHPLEQYLREAGEAPELMPGGVAEFLPELENRPCDSSFEEVPSQDTYPKLLRDIAQTLCSLTSPHSTSAFVERFKYNVISSPLLSPSLLQPHVPRSHRLPGHHSRDSSLGPSDISNQPTHSLPQDPQYYTFFLTLALVTVLFGAGFYFTSLLLFGISASLLYIWNPESSSKYDMTPYLDTLNDLIAAGNVWDSAVQEAMTTLEKNEEHTSVTPFTPSSTLRVALHSALLTTQSQCDDVRQLLSALTAHSELSQISEMYAPPSPMPSRSFPPFSPSRPSSYPETTHRRTRTLSVPETVENKRATWNGSYSYLANAGSPSLQLTKRREKRRSDLSALLQATGPTVSIQQSRSAPATPILEDQSEGVQDEELRTKDTATFGESPDDPEEYQPFGPSALRLRRTRTIGALNALSSSVPSSPPNKSMLSSSSLTSFPARSPRTSQFATVPSASRFTAMQAPRHPLSLSSLNIALQAALASKRFACSHLLALRFAEEGDDQTYWEDVKSVMMLLTSTFVDASARLTEALDFVEDQRLKDETPSPGPSRVELSFDDAKRLSFRSGRRSSQRESFAPMPSDLSRFATHVEAISSTLNDAREQLITCVAALKSSRDGADGADPSVEASPSCAPPATEEHPALQAYERLRRELGFALRECERGRERLLDIVSPPRQKSNDSEDESSPQNISHDLPNLGHDASDESPDRPNAMPLLEHEISVHSGDDPDHVAILNSLDDVTSHLLFTSTSQHLPPPGIEQVYEGDSGAVSAFNRERSKLSREERIQLAKQAKEDGTQMYRSEDRSSSLSSSSSRERWGPGGEVVQELRDVIWKVGERRRKMVDGQIHNVVPEAIRVLN